MEPEEKIQDYLIELINIEIKLQSIANDCTTYPVVLRKVKHLRAVTKALVQEVNSFENNNVLEDTPQLRKDIKSALNDIVVDFIDDTMKHDIDVTLHLEGKNFQESLNKLKNRLNLIVLLFFINLLLLVFLKFLR